MGMAAALERVAAEIARLPEAKEGEAVQLVSKDKLNELYESIRREREKREREKRELQAKTISLEGYGNTQGLRLEDTALLRRRASADKRTEGVEAGKEMRDFLERKGVDISEKRGVDISEKRGVDISEKRGVDISEKRGVDISERKGVEKLTEEVVRPKFLI